MISKSQITHITSLHSKKFRKIHQLFIAEGAKVIREFIAEGWIIDVLYTTNPDLFSDFSGQLIEVSPNELSKISALTTANDCLAVIQMPQKMPVPTTDWIVMLDNIRDPGNLGTIIRLCDWFGIQNIICNPETVDVYNPKVVQATMGSLARVTITVTELDTYLHTTELPVYGTYMDGSPLYTTVFPDSGVMIFGNEANGISDYLNDMITHRITIPRYGKQQRTESLNVAMATAIILNEIRRE